MFSNSSRAIYSEFQPTRGIPARDLYATPRYSAPQMRFYEIAACARQARSSSPGGTSESRNKPLRATGTGTGTEPSRRSNRRTGYGGYDLRGFARHVGERTASLVVFSHAIETNVLKCTHERARV